MNITAKAAELDTLFSDDPFELDMSGVVSLGGPLVLPREAEIPSSSRGAQAGVDFSFLDGALDEDQPGSVVQQDTAGLEKRFWSSLAVVLLLHAGLLCLFHIHAETIRRKPQDH